LNLILEALDEAEDVSTTLDAGAWVAQVEVLDAGRGARQELVASVHDALHASQAFGHTIFSPACHGCSDFAMLCGAADGCGAAVVVTLKLRDEDDDHS
jgi:hypothetical protein